MPRPDQMRPQIITPIFKKFHGDNHTHSDPENSVGSTHVYGANVEKIQKV